MTIKMCIRDSAHGEHDVVSLKDTLVGRQVPELGRWIKGDVSDVVVELDEFT